MRAVVVGAGIVVGAATALALAEAGADVVVLERHRPGAMASGWTLGGVRQSGRDPAELALAREAVRLWAELDDRLGDATGFRRTGNLRLACDEGEAATICAMAEDQRARGLAIELLKGAAPREADACVLVAAVETEPLPPALGLVIGVARAGSSRPLDPAHAGRGSSDALGVR